MKIELSDGGWADVRDPRKLTERQSEGLEDAQFELMLIPAVQDILRAKGNDGFEKLQEEGDMGIALQLGVPGLKAMRGMRRATVVAYVSAWSYSDHIDADAVMDAPSAIVNELSNKIGEIIKATGGSLVKTDPSPDPKALTSNSSESNGHLRVAPLTQGP